MDEDEHNANPYGPPSSEFESAEHRAFAKRRTGLALITVSAIACLLSALLGYVANYFVDGYQDLWRFAITGINGVVMLFAIPLEATGLVYVALSEGGSRKAFAIWAAIFCVVLAIAPGIARVYVTHYEWVSIGKLLYNARWVAILFVIRWQPWSADAPLLTSSRFAWVLLTVALVMKVVEILSSVIGSHQMWAFRIFVAALMGFLIVLAAHANWLRRALANQGPRGASV